MAERAGHVGRQQVNGPGDVGQQLYRVEHQACSTAGHACREMEHDDHTFELSLEAFAVAEITSDDLHLPPKLLTQKHPEIIDVARESLPALEGRVLSEAVRRLEAVVA